MRLEPVQSIEAEAATPVLTEAKILENKDPIVPKEKKEEVKFHAHLFTDQTKETYVEKVAPMLAQKIPEPKRGLITNKSVDFLIGKFEPGKFNQTYVSTVRDLTKNGLKANEITELVQQTYGNLPGHVVEKVEKELTAKPEGSTPAQAGDSGAAEPKAKAEAAASPAPSMDQDLTKDKEAIEKNKGPAADLNVVKAKAQDTVGLRREPAIDLDQLRAAGKDLLQVRNEMAIEQAREITSRRQQPTLAEVRELSEELARIRKELVLQRVDEVKDQMVNVLKDAANGTKNLSVAVASWVKEVASHVGELTHDAIEKFKKSSTVSEYATLFKSAMKEPEKYMKGKELYERDYEAVEKKLQESTGTSEKPPKLLVRLYANSLAYQG